MFVMKNLLFMKDTNIVVLDVEGIETAKPYKLGFAFDDTMKLLVLLQDMQKKLGVSLPDVPIDVADVPPEDNLH